MLHIFLPQEKNDHRPLALRHPALGTFFVILLTIQLVLNNFYSTDPHILGFATSIYQKELIELTNKERENAGLSPLTESPVLDKAAYLKAQDMLADNYWAHVAPDGTTPWVWFDKEGYNFLMAGENLAKDFNTSAGVISGWMRSPTHKENLLNNKFTEIGMAVVNGKLLEGETTLVVQFFGLPADSAGLPASVAYAAEEQPPAVPGTAREEFTPASTVAVISEGAEIRPAGMPAQTLSGLAELKFRALEAIQPSSWGLGQSIMIVGLVAFIILYLNDSLSLWRAGILRKNSHSLIHASALTLLLATVIFSNGGVVL
ncbi:MAG: hypothetical protein FJ044_00055 [Candidatus Cloacimonetes bacterium]|nr:hypothetical protein [Candidatus Cloacimonadota bacterium]